MGGRKYAYSTGLLEKLMSVAESHGSLIKKRRSRGSAATGSSAMYKYGE
jgi:hypothetical protein